jgi:hypothetical protein
MLCMWCPVMHQILPIGNLHMLPIKAAARGDCCPHAVLVVPGHATNTGDCTHIDNLQVLPNVARTLC